MTFTVIYPLFVQGSSSLGSTAILHTSPVWQGVQLWLHRPRDPGLVTLGQLTTAPSVSSPARHRALASQRFAHQSDQHAACTLDHVLIGRDIAYSDS
jgi:hypothetical protein